MITKFDKYNESVRDLMTPKSEEEIQELRRKGHRFSYPTISDDFYTEKQAISIIKAHSKKLNSTFKDDSARRVVEWLYEWNIPNSMDLTLSLDRGRYTIGFSDSREHSLRKTIDNFINPSYSNGSRYQFIKSYYYLEDALSFLKECNIDVSGVTKK